jgi:hypothetical protein
VRVRLCTNCLSVVYVVKRTAELAPCRIICNTLRGAWGRGVA